MMIVAKLVPFSMLYEKDKANAEMILYWYHEALRFDNLLPDLFYSEADVTPKQLAEIALDKNTLFMLIYNSESGLPIGHFHVNSFDGLTCMGHFSFLRHSHGKKALTAGRQVLQQFFSWKQKGSEYPVATSILGLTPKTNRLAYQFVTKLGFKPVIEIPDACYIRKKDQYVPGVLSILYPHQLGG